MCMRSLFVVCLVVVAAAGETVADDRSSPVWDPIWELAGSPVHIEVVLEGDAKKAGLTKKMLRTMIELGLRRNGVPTAAGRFTPLFKADVMVLEIDGNFDRRAFSYRVNVLVLVGVHARVLLYGFQTVNSPVWRHGMMGYGDKGDIQQAIRTYLAQVLDEFSLSYLKAGEDLNAGLQKRMDELSNEPRAAR